MSSRICQSGVKEVVNTNTYTGSGIGQKSAKDMSFTATHESAELKLPVFYVFMRRPAGRATAWCS